MFSRLALGSVQKAFAMFDNAELRRMRQDQRRMLQDQGTQRFDRIADLLSQLGCLLVGRQGCLPSSYSGSRPCSCSSGSTPRSG
jgi:hypothetical protein